MVSLTIIHMLKNKDNMGVNLTKGGKILLEKANESGTPLTGLTIGLGWDVKPGASSGSDFDLDASIVCLGTDGNALPGGMLYYNSPTVDGKLTIFGGALIHSGDNLTGEGEGDDESIMLDFSKIPAEVDKMIVVVDIYQAESRSQNFGMAENSFVRLLNPSDGNKEMARFDLNFDASTATGVKFATIFRKGTEWAFSADQVEFSGGLAEITKEYNVTA